MKVTGIKLKRGCGRSYSVLEVDEIYVTGYKVDGFYKKEEVHDFLRMYPGSIRVGIFPFPVLVPAVSANGERYVRSQANGTVHDNLMELPRG